eukprot:3680447-Prymnesium_polylepis.1
MKGVRSEVGCLRAVRCHAHGLTPQPALSPLTRSRFTVRQVRQVHGSHDSGSPCPQPTGKAWPLEASGALARVNSARDAAASCATRKAHGD